MSASGEPSHVSIGDAIVRVREEIQRACINAGRDTSSVRLIGVTKTRSVEEVCEAISSGVEDLGENYIQEARTKARKLPGARWHMIGHLQKNKVNLAVDLFEVVHSLDSLSLIQRLESRCRERRRMLTGLIQVHLGSESTKYGLQPAEVFQVLDDLAKDPPTHLRLAGLMTIPPPVNSPEDNRPYFKALRETLKGITERRYTFWAGEELSMGMSDDYLVAIEEGATMIRLGRILFGQRPAR